MNYTNPYQFILSLNTCGKKKVREITINTNTGYTPIYLIKAPFRNGVAAVSWLSRTNLNYKNLPNPS